MGDTTLTPRASAVQVRPSAVSDLIFTEYHAPVEFIADSLVLRFALEGGAAQFPAQP